MSAVGLPMDGHVAPHLDSGGFCWCPCDQCTGRPAKLCVCLDCACDTPAGHYAQLLWRITLYGTCEACGDPRDVQTREAGSGKLVELLCPACGYAG